MASIGNFTLNGVPFDTVREAKGWSINAQFGLNPQPSINLENLSITNTEKSNTKDKFMTFHDDLPTEGCRVGFDVSDGLITFPFTFIADYNSLIETAVNEITCNFKLDKSIDSLLDLQGEDITMSLLKYKGYLNSSHYVAHPYIIQNRKTVLEKLSLATNSVLIIKSMIDEMFKLINIAADITSGGVVQALINLGQSIAGLVLLSNQIADLITKIRESFFPPILYHSAIKLKTFIQRSCDYLGYSVEFGTWTEDIVLIPSKYDEVGYLTPEVVFFQDGILKVSDFGHNLKESFALAKQLANINLGIIDNTLHCRPLNDPFWESISSYVMPSVLIETSVLANNGTKRKNREDLYVADILEYSTDDSDYWTIQANVNDSNGDRYCTALTSPILVVNQRDVNLRGIKRETIPYALAVRKGVVNDLLDSLNQLNADFYNYVTNITEVFGGVESILDETLPSLPTIEAFIETRNGALKVENHFFSTPKISILEPNALGELRIPENFNDLIGAKALFKKYFNYNSLVPGVRNPLDFSDTNGKEIFENVRIRFNIKEFEQLLNNSYFYTEDGKKGKFTAINWDVDKDSAVCDFWVKTPWLKNVEQVFL